MDTLEDIKAELRRLKPEIESRYPIRLVSIFGSFVRGEQTAESDVDVLAEETGMGLRLFDVFAIERLLAKRLHRKVEIIMEKGLHQRIRGRVLAEAQSL
jgi:uncharacterized protein